MDALQTASGIIRIVNTHMAVDLRLALQEQGQDPRSFTLVAFGGAGPLHAATLARSVGIPTVLVPLYPGLNCALGMLQTSVRHSYLQVGNRIARAHRNRARQRAFRRARGAGHAGGDRGGLLRRARPRSRGCSICAIRIRAIRFAFPVPRRSTRPRGARSRTPSTRCIRTYMARARRTRMPRSSPSACNRRSQSRASPCLNCLARTATRRVPSRASGRSTIRHNRNLSA